MAASSRFRFWPALAVALALATPPGTAPAHEGDLASNSWSRVSAPSPGASRAVGSAAHGCLAGAAQLPVDGPGYEAIRLSRRRYFGHPDTVDFVQSLGRRAQAAGLPLVYVGDMSQPRGGPLPYGHASHQSGLDVDIWFTLEGRKLLQPAAREDLDLPSMLQPSWRSIDPKRFTARQVMLLRLAAADPRVDRIFVNPAIKAALCRGFAGATRNGRAWLQRIRPWWGHDEHFHVRLRCPANSPDCEPQAPLPPGDGCDAGLTAWLRSQHPLPPSPAHPVAARPMPTLPPMCHALLSERPRLAEP